MSPIRRPTRREVRIFPTAGDFRRWLAANHATRAELWVGYYRRGAGKAAMTYPEAVDEALCFGWIDGIAYRVDEEVRTNRFTPRRPRSNWSRINIARAEALIAAGRMAPAGLRAFERRDRSPEAATEPPGVLPRPMLARLRADARARAFWEAQPAGYRRNAARWIMSAKQQSTRDRRLATLVADAAAGLRVKPLR